MHERLELTFWPKAVALHSNMHDIGDKMYITLQQINITEASQPLCFI